MRVLIVSTGYAWFPCEPGPSRFFYIANLLSQKGWDVEVLTTDFQHFEKRPRNISLIQSQNYPFKITFIHATSYKKNIDVRRIISNYVVEKNIVNYLKNLIEEYDAVYCSIPANNVAAKVSILCKEKEVPFIVDIEDLWPEAMSMIIKNSFMRNFLLAKTRKDAETTYKNASAVIGTSEDYTNRAFLNREKNIPYKTVYVGVDIAEFDNGVDQYESEIIKPENEFWVTYSGSISTSYDIKTLIDAGYLLKAKNVHIQILGTGSLKNELEKYSDEMDNIHFWGFVSYAKMAAALSKSDVLVNSFVKGAPQSIVNKIGDYLASGKPMINTLENPSFCKIVSLNQVGKNIKPGDSKELASTIELYLNDKTMLMEMGKNARKLAERSFNREESYLEIAEMIIKLVENNYES